jgi:hypothetical protein
MMKNFLGLAALSGLLVGCASSKITNLTPTRVERNSSNLYPIEAAWETREHVIRPESLQPKVVVGTEAYPMQRVPVVKNRWETLIPVPPNENSVRYKFKFDYDYNSIPVPRRNSKLSPEYKLEIVDKK